MEANGPCSGGHGWSFIGDHRSRPNLELLWSLATSRPGGVDAGADPMTSRIPE